MKRGEEMYVYKVDITESEAVLGLLQHPRWSAL